MSIDVTIRFLCLIGCACIAGVAFGRALQRRGVLRLLNLTLAAFAGNGVLGQATLIHDPLTVRTVGSLVAVGVGVVWLIVLKLKGPPAIAEDRPLKENR